MPVRDVVCTRFVCVLERIVHPIYMGTDTRWLPLTRPWSDWSDVPHAYYLLQVREKLRAKVQLRGRQGRQTAVQGTVQNVRVIYI